MGGVSLVECENAVLRRKHNKIKEQIAWLRKLSKMDDDSAKTQESIRYKSYLFGRSDGLKQAADELEQILNK